MPTLSQLGPRIFRHANRRYGKPYMLVVRPLTQWALPAGFAYDATVDAIANGGGTILPNPEDYWVTDAVYIVPVASVVSTVVEDIADRYRLSPLGMVASGEIMVWIAGATDIERVQVAHSIQLGNRWYDVENVQEAPSGYPAADGLWALIRLRARS